MKFRNKPYYLGIDTSVYTTSLAVIFDNDHLLSQKQVVKLPKGERDLKQSFVLFKHIRRLPLMLAELNKTYGLDEVKAIAVSTRPRPIQSSYMPVFEGGKAIARVLATSLNVPLYELSHQENHIEAILKGTDLKEKDLKDPFLAVHFSGEESEILTAKLIESGYSIQRVAGSLDLDAGMLIDRVGLKLDLNFPAGAELEQVALNAIQRNVRIPSRLEKNNFHFRAQESYIRNLIAKGTPAEEIAYGLFKMIAKTLSKSIKQLIDELEFSTILFSGGVMSNTIIREHLIRKLRKKNLRLCFASPEFCSDNAIGNVALAKRLFEGNIDGNSDILR